MGTTVVNIGDVVFTFVYLMIVLAGIYFVGRIIWKRRKTN